MVQVWKNSVVTEHKVKIFEERLDKYWKKHLMILDFNTAYNTMAGSCTLTLSDNDRTEPNIEEQSDLLRLEKHWVTLCNM